MLPRVRLFAIVAVALLALGCGNSSSTGTDNNGNGSGPFSATIDGAPWSSPALYATASASANGTFTIAGSTGTPGGATMSLTLYNIDKQGTYPLGVSGTLTGGSAVIVRNSVTYLTPLSGNAGSVTVSAVSATHIAGTFNYVGAPVSGVGTVIVDNGNFDIPVSSSGSIAVAANMGGSWSGTINNTAWRPATFVMVTKPSSGTLTLGASNSTYFFNFVISGFTGATTYTMGTGASRTLTVTNPTSSQAWGGSASTTSGTLIITSATTTRIGGNYNITVQPTVGGGSALTLAGTFDVGIPN